VLRYGSSDGLSEFILVGMTVGSMDSRFVGRAEELSRLLAAVGRAEQGKPAMLLLAGDAGVGKTRLLAELAHRAQQRGVQVLLGGCLHAGDVGLPYVPVVSALRGFAASADNEKLVADAAKALPSLGRLLPDWAIEPTSAAPLEGALGQLQLFDAVCALLLRLSTKAPVLVILEDLHWADRSTRDLLAFLIRTLRGGRVALVASYRSDELNRRHPLRPLLAELVRVPDLERIDLAPFGRAELAEHLQAVAGQPVPPAVVDRILARSEGNAFFAEELVAAGAIRADIALPEALADVLLGRIETLSRPAQDLLRIAAVAGRQVHHRTLAEATGLPESELEERLREAIAARVLVVDTMRETYAFRHALLQEALYGDLLPGERTRLHAAYAQLLAAAGPRPVGASRSAAELAWHSLASHNLPGGLAALVRAATHATAVFAPAEAFQHLTQALELWDRVPNAAVVAGADRVELLLRAAEAANQAGEFGRAVGLAREAVEAIDEQAEPLRAAAAYERLGLYLLEADLELGRDKVATEMVAACRRAVELVPEQPPTTLRARVAVRLARMLANVDAFDEARCWAEAALMAARTVKDAEAEAHALLVLGALELLQDDAVDAAREQFHRVQRRAATAGNRLLDLRARVNLTTLELLVGNLKAACEIAEEAARLAEQLGLLGSPYGLDIRWLRCAAHYAAGNWDAAERLVDPVNDLRRATGQLSAVSLLVEVGRGRHGAEEHIARLAPTCELDPYVALLVGACEADLARWQGNLDRVRALATASVDLDLDKLGAQASAWTPVWATALQLVALGVAAEADRAEQARMADDEESLGDAEAVGKELLERARAWRARAGGGGRHVSPEALAWLARAEADWTRLEGRSDSGRWQAALDAFSFGHCYEVARCQWGLAEALVRADRRKEAEVAARAAYQTALQLQAEPLRRGLDALARRARLDLGRGVPRPQYRARLTPRELEVLCLLVQGRSNRQIGRALFISEKTASVHVSNIMSKLGAANRSEAAAIAHNLDLLVPDA
jgi:DNA-binding CsgD family transcriptional regulator